MKLIYHKGENFGDALNPIIFNNLLPNYFDGKEDTYFLGIGSILGLFKSTPIQKKIIVFSSGYAAGDKSTYGEKPNIDSKFEIICVRGPLTAKELGLPIEIAVSDGALLLPFAIDIPKQEKLYDFSYIPHVGSLNVYDDWENLLQDINIHLIDPTKDVDTVLKEMQQSRVILTEAMHGAIMSDTLRIPWIPVSTIKTINKFKWQDYLASVELKYQPHIINTLYSKTFLNNLFKLKLDRFKVGFLNKIVASLYFSYQNIFKIKRVKSNFIQLKNEKTTLCKSEILEKRQNELLALIDKLKKSN